MKFDPYSLTELIRNDDFIDWVLQPNEERETFWQAFLKEHPEKAGTMASAKEYILLLAEDTGKNMPSRGQSESMWKEVQNRIEVEELKEVVEVRKVSLWRQLRVAASVTIILGIGSMGYMFYRNQSLTRAVAMTEEGSEAKGYWEKVNELDRPQMVLLPDGSSVVLEPGARLQCLFNKQSRKREIRLSGKAFFEIVKDPKHPFLVYSYGIAAKVLGTSFIVDGDEDSKDVKVEVKTGRVSVFRVTGDLNNDKELENAEKKAVILYPDQQVTVSRKTGKPIPPIERIENNSFDMDISRQLFVFDETAVPEVFKSLENSYNVKIQYDAKLLQNCPLTATLVGQSFNQKLAVICAAIDANYEINGNIVTITSSGCQ